MYVHAHMSFCTHLELLKPWVPISASVSTQHRVYSRLSAFHFSESKKKSFLPLCTIYLFVYLLHLYQSTVFSCTSILIKIVWGTLLHGT